MFTAVHPSRWLRLIGIDHPRLQGLNFVGGMRLIPEFLALLIALATYTAAFIAEIMARFGLGGRWAYDTRYGKRRIFGMTELQLKSLYGTAPVGFEIYLRISPAILKMGSHQHKAMEMDGMSM